MINWFLLVNKPLKFTAHDLISVVKKKLNVNKAWHTGTLDPLATWLMLVWIWDATKFLKWHTHDKKSYTAKIKLWEISNTFDWEWVIENTNFKWKITKQQLIEAIEWFKWKITQIPPKYSAIKIQGKKAYDYMRDWDTEIKIPSREVEIFKINILNFEYPNLELDIHCSSWTYIRSIANDLGQRLWCWWYLIWLIRTWIENYSLNQAIETNEISIEKLLPVDFWLQQFEKMEVNEEIIQRLKHGHRIKIETRDKEQGIRETLRHCEKRGTSDEVIHMQDKLLRKQKNILNKPEWLSTINYQLLTIYNNWTFYWLVKISNWILKWEKIINI